ncbi:Phytosulfokine receptor [Thalictrum thalictroides]|uniref:non-specific serine/threonine protein kinase n=1 Tax=Thalictrum thalictroides TaxID=46969 RepID=A0A7J6UU41_THATH|nr:Phytosulfokine receptor [Thalictrum thalictroides]
MKGLEVTIDGWKFTTNDSSSSSDCCSWFGVVCKSSRVIGLEIVQKRLKGNISESLAGLDQLRTLILSQNLLNGPLPLKLFHLQKLEILDLSYNAFNGFIPVEANLPSLRSFNVSQNSFVGAINTGVCKNSTQIRVLDFSMNHFSGNFPVGFGSCTSLQHLSVYSNYLNGSLPEDLFLLRKLRYLHIQDNMLSGMLSDRIGNFSELVRLDVSLNMFSGFLPDAFGSLQKLQRLSLQSNKFVGHIPNSISNSPSIQFLSLRNNTLDGLISLNCMAMVNLSSLDLGTNNFSGPFPDSLSSCRKLTALNLARNGLKGQIPESFKNLQSLSYLSLTGTSLRNISAALFVLQHCKSLQTLVLTANFQSEVMPAVASLHFENLTALVIANCGLIGNIPQWLRSSTKLQLLDLSWNKLSGNIPNWFGGMKFLFYLDLSNNSLSGVIPNDLTKLESLINRNISFHDSSPDFPFFTKRPSAKGFQYNQIGSFPPSLELSYNHLTGPIPPEFGNLKKLLVLDLKSNNLSGSIPSELSGITTLVTLDLSHNNLSGTIPPSLTKLSFLSTFSVANNHLSGRVPSGGQFSTFPNASFEGNNGLCDDHYHPCTALQKFPASSNKAKRNRGIIIGVAVGIAVGTTFLLILVCYILTRTDSHKQNDTKVDNFDSSENVLYPSGSRSVVLFEDEDNNNELFIEDLLRSTNNFDQANIIGCGGFGLVYKATLPDGRKVAIKRLSGDCGQMEREFRAEVEALSRAQHENLVLLQGYCSCKNDRLLIYSYMENGSLDYWLHEKHDGAYALDWETRLRIAQGAARGLAYLHQSCEPHILHRDVKSSNILLDENFEAHLADFGLARLILPYDTHVSTDLVGTLGYIPPEYGQASVATFKGDVYSFGVVLLELLTGKRPMDMCKPKDRRNLISWVFQMKKEKKEAEVIDPFIYDKQHNKEILRALEIACLCLSESPKVRPSTQQIVSWLENIDTYGH